jgi:hypothetical protein
MIINITYFELQFSFLLIIKKITMIMNQIEQKQQKLQFTALISLLIFIKYFMTIKQ